MIRVIEFFIEIIEWIQIVISPLLIGLIVGSIVYFSNPNDVTFLIGITIASLGLVVGIVWASYVWKTEGTNQFSSRIMTTPDLDHIKKEEEIKESTNKNGRR